MIHVKKIFFKKRAKEGRICSLYLMISELGHWVFDILRLGAVEYTWLKTVQKNTVAWILWRSASGKATWYCLASQDVYSLLLLAPMETPENWDFPACRGRDVARRKRNKSSDGTHHEDELRGTRWLHKFQLAEAPWRLCQILCHLAAESLSAAQAEVPNWVCFLQALQVWLGCLCWVGRGPVDSQSVTEPRTSCSALKSQKKRPDWWKGKLALFWMLATGECGTDVCPKTDCPRLLHNQWARVFIAGGRGLHAGIAQSALTIILKLVIGGLTSIILIVLSTVNLQFQGWSVSISLRPILGTSATFVMARDWSPCR